MIAAAKKYAKIIEILLEKNAEIDLQDNDGWTALVPAINTKDKNIVQFLLDKGANINIRDKNGNTPLMFATSKQFKEMVELLLNNSADLHAITYNDVNAFDIAEKTGNEEVLILLERYGAK